MNKIKNESNRCNRNILINLNFGNKINDDFFGKIKFDNSHYLFENHF